MTDRIALDFIRARRWPYFGLLFLLLSCAAATVVAFKWSAARQSNAVLEEAILKNDQGARLLQERRLAGEQRSAPQAQLRRQSETSITDQLDYPWNQIFGEIEHASADDVALLALALDQPGNTFYLTVEARELSEVIGMVDRLNGDAAVKWYISNYQTQPQNNPPTIRAEIVKKIKL